MLTLRPYDLRDLEDAVELWYRTWHQTFPDIQHPQPYRAWKTRFRDDFTVRGDIWVVEVESSLAGFVVVIKEQLYLDQLYVDLIYQNRGIGSSLINKAKEICPEGLKLHTLQQNTKACRFYEKHGFRAGKLSINEINGQPNIEYQWRPNNKV